jgi:hypothetical protein
MLLAELVCLSNQAQDHNGTILAGGRLYVYYKGRTALATTYSDPAGNVENTNPIILDNMGRCSVYASANYSYTLVWCDMYGREKFSYDKDLLDPVPVEDTYSIGIKGDDTIQVNQSTSGQTVVFNLHAKGEDYNGIEPIVVNNDSREISANHKPLGVEAPLTFVQDDEEATIIGFDESTLPTIIEPMVESAMAEISGSYVTSSTFYSAMSGKQDVLSAGQYIDITNNVIGVTGVQPAGSYATTQDFANLSGYINTHEEAWTSANEYSAGNGIDITNNVIAVTGQFGKIYSGAGVINVDNENDVISADLSNYYDKQTVDDHIASAVSSVPQNEYSAGANINVTDYVISGKDWTADITSATSGKQDTLSAGDNIQISGGVISVTGQMGKVYSGENHVVVDNTNDKIGLDVSALSAIDAFQGEFDLSAGSNIAFRLEGHTMYIDATAEPIPYTPIIEDI